MTSGRPGRSGSERTRRSGVAGAWLRVALLALAGLALAADASAWWNTSWSHRRKLTFDNSGQPQNLNSFPVLVVLNSSRINYSLTKNDGSDLRFVDADDLTLLDHEIEKWDESGSSYVWVKVPQVAASSNSDFIWMYYGNAAAAALPLASQQATWSASYSLVMHFDETSGAHADSTANGNNSSVVNVQAQGDPGGQIDGADVFVGASDHNVDVPDNATLDMGANDSFTIEAWVKTTSSDQAMIVSKENGSQEIQLWSDAGTATFWLNDGVDNARIGAAGPSINDGAWHYLVGRWGDGSAGAEIFVDGASQGNVNQPALDSVATATPLVIGEEGDAGRGFAFTGTIDEVRVRKTSGSTDDWIYAQFLTQSDTGAGLTGPFVTYGTEAAHCCELVTTETASTVTVNGPNRFDIRFNTAVGGGIDLFIDREENTAVDLAGGADGTASQPALFADEIQTGSGQYLTSANTLGPKLDLLEATPARVRVREESFYQLVGSTTILPGVKGLGTYSLYSQGRMALDWTRVSTASVPYLGLEFNTTVRWQPTGSLNGWVAYGQSGPLASFGSEDFVLLRNEQPGARTDFLHVLSTDWPAANATGTFQVDGGGAQEWKEATWVDNAPPGTLSASESFSMLYYFKPTTLGNFSPEWLDPAVTSRSNDYRTPSAVTFSAGAGWVDANEKTDADPAGVFFNEAEAAYVFDLDPALGLTFAMNGSPITPRRSPFLKIRRWQSFSETPGVTFDPDGGGPSPAVTLQKNRDYRAAVKPFARAHFEKDLTWYSSLEGPSHVSSPAVGTGNPCPGAGCSGVDFPGVPPYRHGLNARFDADGEYIQIPTAGNFNSGEGSVELWYLPLYDYGAGAVGDDNVLFGYQIDATNYFYAYHEPYAGGAGTGEGLFFEIGAGGTSFSTGFGAHPTNHPVRWRANQWVHLRFAWKADPVSAQSRLEIWIDGRFVSPAPTGSYAAAALVPANMFIGNLEVSGIYTLNAFGRIDEFRIYDTAEGAARLAHGGLTTDPTELLGDPADDYTFTFATEDANHRGEYLWFGADSKFRGINISLDTPGIGAGLDLEWHYWDGFSWQDLEANAGVFTDQTDHLTKPAGTIFWSADPTNWAPYSLRGGPDLYYVRARLKTGTYSGQFPRENVIKTDILLFQYCHDVTTNPATFAFAVPPTTEVKLASLSAVPSDGSVLLEWRTASELDNLGFHVYRGLSASGPWTRLNPSLIPGLGSSPVGQAYSFRDAGLTNGTRYFYRLEDVDAASKSTSHGPVSAVPQAGASAGGAPSREPPASGGGKGQKKAAATPCPDWVLAAYASSAGADDATASLTCTRHGDPEATSLGVVSRSARDATLELRTGGFYALHTQAGAGGASGTVRVFVPGFDFPQDSQAAALPVRRALADAVVGRRVQLGGVRALELVSFKGLVPSALGKAEMQVGRDGTVRARRRAARAYGSPGLGGQAGRGEERASKRLPKAEIVTLLPSVFQGETKSAVVEIAPLRYDPQRGLVLAKRVRVKLLFTGRETGESGRGSVGRAPGSRKPVAGELLARLYTTSRGLYSASFELLFPGRPRGFAASQLRLERQGEPVSFHLEPASDSFGPGSRLYFLADRTSASTDFSAEVAYELVRSRDGVRMPLESAAPGSIALTSASVVSRSFETNRFYQPGLLDAPDPWLWEALASGATRVKSFSVSGVDAAAPGTAELEVFLQGASESGQAVDHHVSVSLNGTLVGEAQFAGKQPYRMGLSLPVSLLREGANDLQLTNVADTGVSSFVFLDRFVLSYAQVSSLTSGVFEGTWAEAGTASLAGVSGPVVLLDVTATASATSGTGPADATTGTVSSARWFNGYQAASGSLRFHAEAGRRYRAESQAALLAPRVALPEPSTLGSATNQAEYLLIAPKAFLAAAEPLVQRRQDQGLATRVVSLEEIADAFGHGRPSAEAIKRFLAFAFHSWARPSPRYVLLLGDSSYDPRNFIGTSQPSPLPALWAKTSYLWTVSDPQLGAVNGDDALPDIAIGRLPAATVEQAEALVAKLIAWEDSGQGLNGAAALVADNPDLAGDFEADVENIRASFLGSREARVLKLRELGGALRPSILEALNSGLSYLSYVGHGGAAVWASENVWNSWDAASLLAQSRQPLLVTMNCLNGYFVAPAFDSLAESLLKAEGRGAIAAFSPSGLSLDGPAHQYHRALMAALTSGQHARLGDAILAAQKTYVDSGLMPELVGVYHLLGDPATVIR